MSDPTKNLLDIYFSAAQLVVLIVGAAVAYFRLWREAPMKARIEFDLDCHFLGVQDNQRIVMFTFHAQNKGHVRHTFERISFKVRGIKSGVQLSLREDKRLHFPESLLEAEAIPKEYGYYYVQPGVNQQITFTSMIPEDIRFVRVWAAFRYKNSKDQHTSEKTFDAEIA